MWYQIGAKKNANTDFQFQLRVNAILCVKQKSNRMITEKKIESIRSEHAIGLLLIVISSLSNEINRIWRSIDFYLFLCSPLKNGIFEAWNCCFIAL